MLDLDPAKLLIIAVVALVVLGPDKLPAAARKVSSLLGDLQRLRASVHQQVQEHVGDHPIVTELSGVRDDLVHLRSSVDPRQTLYRSIGLSHDDLRPDPAAPPVAGPTAAGTATGVGAGRRPAGVSPLLAEATTDDDPSRN